ncbi:phosphatase PAP2 family protein [Streptomyces sp. NPDC003027]
MRDADRGWARTAIGAERRLLAALRGCGRRPPVARAARALSFAGEHGAVWLAAGLTGAAVDTERRADWLRGTAVVGAAQLASMGLKRLVRRPRPGVERYAPLVRTAGRHSFPSSHAASAAAAAVALGALRPPVRRLLVPAAAAMCLSRLVVGVHYPTDVVAGVLLGAVTATAGHRRRGGTGEKRPAVPVGGTAVSSAVPVGGLGRGSVSPLSRWAP